MTKTIICNRFLTKQKFDTYSSWEFGWAVLEPILILPKEKKMKSYFQKRFLLGQKRFISFGI